MNQGWSVESQLAAQNWFLLSRWKTELKASKSPFPYKIAAFTPAMNVERLWIWALCDLLHQ